MKKLSIFVATLAILAGGAVTSQARDVQSQDAAHGAHNWARGKNLPNHYFTKEFAVGDWRSHNLRDPGEDGRWVHDEDGNYILVSLGTHTIEDIVAPSDHP